MSKPRFAFSIIFLLLFTMLFLSGCSLKLPKLFPEPAQISNLPAEALFIDKDAIYNQTLTLIQSAQTSIYVEQVKFDDPRLIQLLLTKSRIGIDVHILLDQWQKVNWATLDLLKSQNVSIQYYPAQKGQVNHTKFLIVDQKVAMIYGPSWTEDGLLSHDLAVKLSGESAWKVAALFSEDWQFTTTFPLPILNTSPLPDDKIILARNANIKKQLTEQISSSTKSIWIEISEMNNVDLDLIQSLIDAAEQGLDVRVILGGEVTNKTQATLEQLKAKNIIIRYYPSKTPLGMNLAIFDNSSFLLSSSHWTRYSFVANHEFSITVPSPVASAKLGNLFNQDWKKSTEERK